MRSLLLAFLPSLLLAQPASFQLTVVDPAGKPVEFAQVSLTHPASSLLISASTNSQGQAVLPLPERRQHKLTVTATGFQEFSRMLSAAEAARPYTAQLEVLSLAQQMTISANLIAGATEHIANIPGSVDVLDKTTLNESRLFTFDEALRKVSGINTRPEEGFGLRPNIGIRGINPTRSTRVLLLEDGVPLSYAPYGDNASYYHPPVERFEAVEVVKGSGQILYGPMTVGGVINYVTPAIPATPSGTLSLSGGNRDYMNAHLRYGGTFRNTGLLLDGLRKQGEGSRDNVRSGLNDFTFKTLSTLSDRATLSLKANVYTEDSRVTYSGLTEAEFRDNPRQNPFRNDYFYGNRYGLSGLYTHVLGNDLIFTSAGYFSRFERDWWRQSSNSAQRPNTNCGGMANLFTTCGNEGRLRYYDTWGIEPKFKSTRRFGALAETDFGFRAHFEKQDRYQLNGLSPLARTGATVESNLRQNQALSTFLQPRFAFGKWNIIPGIRLEHVRYQRTNRLFDNGRGARGETTLTKFIPGIGVAYNAASSLTIFAGAHRGFAPPRNEDIISNAGGFLDLDAELSWNYEAGFRYRASRNSNFAATFFRMDYQNQVVPASLAGGLGALLTNGGQTLHQGIEVSGRHDFRNIHNSRHSLYVSSAVTLIPTARFEGVRFSSVGGFNNVNITGNRLPYAPRSLANVNLGWYHTTGIHAFVEAVETGRQYGDDLNTVEPTANGQRGALPSYTLFNATVNMPLEAVRSTLFFTVKNIGDRIAIVDRARGILPTHPRLIQGGIQYRF